ncbi:MAG TPA: FAD-binding oxidoreductase [Acidimicrobiales bacterium]|nr:FAD-binding oxidoreductase [Acidimicrobiales bacterium]
MSSGAELDAFLVAARAAVGRSDVLTDPDLTEGYAVDWTRRWRSAAAAVVRPATADQVAALVTAARRHRVALVPQGGNTGLVGGSVPRTGAEVVLSLRRLDDLGAVDVLAGQVTAGAGVTLAALQAHAAAAGLAFGIDTGARESATVGGMIATNAGGVHVVRHGSMRAQVVGVEAVLGTGEVVSRLGGLVKDNTGYDLGQLLCGSEGTLGVVTRARLRLVADEPHVVVAVLGLAGVGEAVSLASGLHHDVAEVRALELMEGGSLRVVAGYLGAAPPVAAGAGAYLLVEAAGRADPTAALADAIGCHAGLAPVAVGVERVDRERLWRWREACPEAAAALGVVLKFDVTLPAAAIAEFCSAVSDRLASGWPRATTLLYGHVGDGNIHVNVVGPDPDDDAVDEAVLDLVVGLGGSISAEHGIGVAKKAWLARDRSAAEVAAMRAIKHALDPDGILNPWVLLP